MLTIVNDLMKSDAFRRSLQGQAISTDYSKKSNDKKKELDIALLGSVQIYELE